MKIRDIFLADFFSFAILIMSGIVLVGLFCYQPKISDDMYVLWSYQNANGIIDYWIEFYRTWAGRAPLILLTSIVLPHSSFEFFYRGFIMVEVLVMIGLAWYCALGKKGFDITDGILQVFVLFGALLWLALPARNETVSWLSGNFVYLVSVILGLAFLACSRHFLKDARVKSSASLASIIITSPFYFMIGFFAGASQEQIIAACMVFTVANIYGEFGLKSLESISIKYWILLMGFIGGASFFILAPGNYVRLNGIPISSFLEVVKRMVLYVPGAFYEIGMGEMGKPIWLGIIVLFALFYKKQSEKPDNVREAKIWIYVCLGTLLALTPATTQISPRTTFFAIIFLYIAVASFLFKGTYFPKRPIVSMALLLTSLLVLVEANVGLISNISVASEFNHRWALINANQSEQMTVPFIATVPSNLSYIQTPEQDRTFLNALSAHVGFKVEHDTSEGAPLPASFKPLKAIKFQ
jgi:hypothetical protein